MKYPDFTFGRTQALIDQLGGIEVVNKILNGDLKVSVQGPLLQVIEGIKPLFDKNGRRIPFNLKAAVCDPARNYFVEQPPTNYKRSFLKGFTNTGLDPSMSLVDYEDQAERLLDELSSNKQLKNLLKSPYFPIIIPKTYLTDLGAMIEEFVTAAGKSYEQHYYVLDFSYKHSFTNYQKNTLKGSVTVVKGSRYKRIVEQIQKESLVGIYFPTALQGFSVNADIEQMSSLPESFILSGPLDVAMAFVMYPDILGRDSNTPIYDCSAVNWASRYSSLNFGVEDDCMDFGKEGNLSNTDGRRSGGLFFIG